MMIRTIIFIISFCIGCSHTNTKIIGNWFFFENDSAYVEAYFDSNTVVMKDIMSGRLFYNYEISDDSLFLWFSGKQEVYNLGLVNNISENKLSLITEEDTLYLYKFFDEVTLTEDSDTNREVSPFIERALKHWDKVHE